MNEPFVIERTLNAPIEKVWGAISDNNEMKQWYFNLPDFKAEPGFEFTFKGGPDDGPQYVHLCRVTEVIPLKKLAYSWRYEGYAGDSLVTWELFPESDKTRLKLTHSGLETFPAAKPDFARKNFEMGWTEIVGKLLPNHVERIG